MNKIIFYICCIFLINVTYDSYATCPEPLPETGYNKDLYEAKLRQYYWCLKEEERREAEQQKRLIRNQQYQQNSASEINKEREEYEKFIQILDEYQKNLSR